MAFNKPASQSSTWQDDKNNWGVQYAVNGKANCDIQDGPVAATKDQYQPWFKVDLQGTFFIKTVVVNPRNCKSPSASILPLIRR